MKRLFILLALLTFTVVSSNAQSLHEGDVNGDGNVNITDVVILVNRILSNDSYQTSSDANSDGKVDITDVVLVVNYIFNGNHTSCPDSNHPHMIDLGLPSGTKWACCNVGATKPEQYGGYYAWGEVSEKSVYNHVTYQYATGVDNDGDGSYDDYHGNFTYGVWQNLGSDIAGTLYDVAHVQWGGSWVMPSHDQINELLDHCSSEWTSENGVYGRRFIGSNGGSIFLPAVGFRWYGDLYNVGAGGYYWSSTQNSDYSFYAFDLGFYSGYADWYYNGRDVGQSVRPVVRN